MLPDKQHGEVGTIALIDRLHQRPVGLQTPHGLLMPVHLNHRVAATSGGAQGGRRRRAPRPR
jgi:hypothetical protein